MAARAPDPTLAPRSEAGRELAALVAARQELDDRADELDVQQRQVSEEVARLSAELADLERRAAAGEQVTAAARSKAEEALVRARVQAAAPWAERREGVRAAAREADAALRTFVAEHLDELLAEAAEDAEDAAEAVNRACRLVESAFHARQAAEQRVTWLASLVRIPRVGDVQATRAEAVVREANRLLAEGGETPPLLKIDPRRPRHATTIAETEQPDPAPLPTL